MKKRRRSYQRVNEDEDDDERMVEKPHIPYCHWRDANARTGKRSRKISRKLDA